METLLKNNLKNYYNKNILLSFKNFYTNNNIPIPFTENFIHILENNLPEKIRKVNQTNNNKLIISTYEYNLELYQTNLKQKLYYTENNSLNIIIENNINKIIKIINYVNNLFVLNHYNLIIKNPVLLDKKAFPNIKSFYSVTDKADGKRMLLFYDESKSFLYSNEPHIDFKIKNKITHSNYSFTLLDGEYIENLNTYLVFDGLFINGQNIQYYSLINRLKFIDAFIKNISKSDIKIQLKQFYFDSNYKDLCQKAYQIYQSKHPYHLDGLIYTPIDDVYYNRTNTIKQTYKWKPLIENTIDFYVLKLNPSLYGLVVSSGKDKLDKSLNQRYFPWITEFKTIPYIFYKQPLHKYTELKKYENKIVEMFYDFNNKIFKVHRIREDKMANYESYKKQGIFRGPNGFKTALSTFQYIKNPIHTSKILCTQSNYWNDLENYSNKIKDIKRFHNNIKRTLYNQYLSKFNKPIVLEIGSGRGGDLKKLKNNEVQYVLMTNIDKGGINEAKVRYNNMNKKNFKVDFFVANSSKNITNQISTYTKGDKYFFDIVSVQFALHYFLKTKTTFQNFFNNINSFLKSGGYIIATFLDGDSLNTIFKKQNEVKFMGSDNKPIFSIEKKYKMYKNYGSSIMVTGKTIGTHEEYLVNIDFLTQYFEENNYKLVDTQLFSILDGFKNMKDGADYSAINRYIVFQKQV